MYHRLLFLLTALLALSGCAELGAGVATPTPWSPPATPVVEAPEATATPATTLTPLPETEATPTPAPDLTSYTVQRGTVDEVLQLEGLVVPVQQRELSFQFDGIVSNILVTPDSPVVQGQVLAELDIGLLPDQLAQAQDTLDQEQRVQERATAELQFAAQRAAVELEAARARLKQLQTPPDAIQIARARALVQQAQAALAKTRNDASAVKNKAEQRLRQAERALQEVQAEYGAAVNANQRSDDAASRARVADARAALRRAETELADAKIEYDTAFNNEIALVQTAEASLTLAQADLDRLLRGPEPGELLNARIAVQVAEIALAEARERALPNPEQIRRVEAAQQEVALLQAQIDARRLLAPFDGQVLDIDASIGSPVRANEAVITMIDPSVSAESLEIRTNAAIISNPGRIQVGQSVELAFARYPGQTFRGQITRIPVAQTQDTAITGPGNAYHVAFEAATLQLAANDRVTVRMIVGRKDQVLWLPIQALTAQDGRSFVRMMRNGSLENREIQVGIRGLDRVEIVRGLNEGDTVYGSAGN